MSSQGAALTIYPCSSDYPGVGWKESIPTENYHVKLSRIGWILPVCIGFVCPELKGCSSYFTLYSLKHPSSSKGPRCDLGGDINSSQGASFRKKWHVLCVDPQQTRDIHPMLDQCWATVYDAGPALIQHCVDIILTFGGEQVGSRASFIKRRQTNWVFVGGAQSPRSAAQSQKAVSAHLYR